MDGDGLLSLQFLMPSPRPGAGMAGARQDAFVDFVVSQPPQYRLRQVYSRL